MCAMTDLSRWERACEDAWTAKLAEIGYFRAETGAPSPHPTRKAKKKKPQK
jgi:hypothetical protein